MEASSREEWVWVTSTDGYEKGQFPLTIYQSQHAEKPSFQLENFDDVIDWLQSFEEIEQQYTATRKGR